MAVEGNWNGYGDLMDSGALEHLGVTRMERNSFGLHFNENLICTFRTSKAN